jgi:hypothetical protein
LHTADGRDSPAFKPKGAMSKHLNKIFCSRQGRLAHFIGSVEAPGSSLLGNSHLGKLRKISASEKIFSVMNKNIIISKFATAKHLNKYDLVPWQGQKCKYTY